MRYIINQKYFTFRDSFNITDDRGRPVYNVTSKLISVSKEFRLNAMNGQEILYMKRKIRLGFPKFNVFIDGTRHILTIHKKYRAFGVKVEVKSDAPAFGDCMVRGNAFNWDFHMIRDCDGAEVATISKKVLKIADSYAIDIAPSEKNHDYLVLAIAIVLDYLCHPKH